MNFHVVTEMVGGSSDNGNLKTFLECIKNGPTRFVFIFQVVWFWNPILEIFFGNVQNIKLICYLETLSRKSKFQIQLGIATSKLNSVFSCDACTSFGNQIGWSQRNLYLKPDFEIERYHGMSIMKEDFS